MVFLYKPEIKTNATKFDFNIQSPVYGKAENIYISAFGKQRKDSC